MALSVVTKFYLSLIRHWPVVNPTYIMSSNVNKIVENVPFPTIFPIFGEPNNKTIAGVYFKLNANSALVQSDLGNGKHGILFLTVSPAVYNTFSATAFIPPVNPGTTAIITAGATAVVIANERQSFTDTTALFKKHNFANKSLKQILLGNIDKMFVRSLQTKYIGYLNVSTRNILEHLYSKYARILAAKLKNNNVALKKAYDPNQPIKILFDQVENALNYAAARNNPFSPDQVVATAFQLFFTTSMFLDDCKTWKHKPDANTNLTNFKTYFSLAHRKFHETRTTTASGAFAAANLANSLSSYQPNASYQKYTVDAITNLASSTAHDRESVATLTATITTLTTELASTNTKLI